MTFDNIIDLLKIANETKQNTIVMYSELEDYASAKIRDYTEMPPKLANQFEYVWELIEMIDETPESNREIDEMFHRISDGVLRYHNQQVIVNI